MSQERATELRDFAYYCRNVAAESVGGLSRETWTSRAAWADDCASALEAALEEARALREAAEHALEIAEHLRSYWDNGSVGGMKTNERVALLRSALVSEEQG